MKKVSRDRGPRASAVADGFSLLEVLIALSLLATIAMTTFSLTAGALRLSRRSAISRQVTRLAASRLEEISRLPYDSPFLAIPGGAYEVVHRERWWPSESRWLSGGGSLPKVRRPSEGRSECGHSMPRRSRLERLIWRAERGFRALLRDSHGI